MQSRIKKSTILIIILITLLLHLLFLYFFTTVPFSYSNNSISQLIDTLLGKEPETHQQPHQLQSHAPQQSAPVIFRDEPEEKEEIKQQAPPPEPKMLVSHAANSSFAKAMADKPLAKPVEEKKEQPKLVKKEEREEEPEEEIKKQEDKNVLRAPPLEQPRDRQDERREEKTISEPKTKKQKLESTMLADWHNNKEITKSVLRAPQDERREKNKRIEDSKRSSSVRPACPEVARGEALEGHFNKKTTQNKKPSPQMSLADLSQQFMQKVATVETGASGALRVQGNSPYGHPSAYQIALERYVAKMCLEIETAYRIETNQSIQATQHKPFLLVVEVNSDGRISTMYPSQSSGIARIDEFAMSIFKSASKSFPKLPEAIGTNFRIQFGINHIDHLGQLRHGILSNG